MMRSLWTLSLLTALAASGQEPSDYLTKEAVIHLSEEVLIGTISTLDIGKNRDLLIVDKVARKVWIFDHEGNFKNELHPEQCHPGFQMNPLDAKYAGDRFILMTNAGPWGYRFKIDGTCLGGLHRDFLAPMQLTLDDQGFFWAFFGERGGYFVHMDSTGKKLLQFDTVDEDFPNLVYRVRGGGSFATDEFVYYASVADQKIYKYDRSGRLVQTIGRTPKRHRAPPQDLPSGVSKRLFTVLQEVMGQSTLTFGLFPLDEDLIMLQYKHGREGFGFQVYNRQGRLLAEDFGMQYQFITAKEGRVYRVVQPELDADGTLPNPFIEVYRYTGPKTPAR